MSTKKSDIKELKNRLTKDLCTFTRVAGCYVNAQKEKITTFSKDFLGLEDEEFFKYLDIAKKSLTGTVGNNLMQLAMSDKAIQKSMLGLKDNGLKSENMLDALYDKIIENYNSAGNFLILLFHDAYDVMTKAADNTTLEDSDEVYTYVLCAICPVELTKPALSYQEDKNDIAPCIRDWVVKPPVNGFLYPAFDERSTDVDSFVFFRKKPKEPQTELLENVLGCVEEKKTLDEKHEILAEIAVENTNDEGMAYELQKVLVDKLWDYDKDDKFTEGVLEDIAREAGADSEQIANMLKEYRDKMPENDTPIADMCDGKLIKACQKKAAEKVQRLIDENDVVVLANDALAVTRREIDGKDYFLVPAELRVEIKNVSSLSE